MRLLITKKNESKQFTVNEMNDCLFKKKRK